MFCWFDGSIFITWFEYYLIILFIMFFNLSLKCIDALEIDIVYIQEQIYDKSQDHQDTNVTCLSCIITYHTTLNLQIFLYSVCYNHK